MVIRSEVESIFVSPSLLFVLKIAKILQLDYFSTQEYETHQGRIEFDSLQHFSNPGRQISILRISGFSAIFRRTIEILTNENP